MRQPIRVPPDDADTFYAARHTAPGTTAPRRLPRRTRPPRYAREGGITDAPAVRAILVVVVVLCAAALVYLIGLAPRPSIGEITPAPNTVAPPGPVEVSASVTGGGKPLQKIVLSIDGNVVQPAVEVHAPQHWVVRYAVVFPKGEHRVELQAFDVDGKSQDHQWSFTASGPRVAPTLAITGPPANERVAPGPVRISTQVTVSGDLTASSVLLNGEPIAASASPLSTRPSGQTASSDRESWIIQATPRLQPGTYTVRISVEDELHGEAQIEQSITVAASDAEATTIYFADTDQYLSGPFKAFWESHDHDLLFGDPVSPEFVDRNGKTVQYFERARFERGADGQVALGLIGDESLPARGEPVENPNNPNVLFFPETQHTVAGKFREFWEQHGGVAIFGFPITEETDEGGTRVQYFERARLDLRPSASGGGMTVQIAPLGLQRWNAVNTTR